MKPKYVKGTKTWYSLLESTFSYLIRLSIQAKLSRKHIHDLFLDKKTKVDIKDSDAEIPENDLDLERFSSGAAAKEGGLIRLPSNLLS